ncbi:MAG: SymE family type I addiction module toxin [Bacteroidota bacterium]
MKKPRVLKIHPKFRFRTWDTITVPEIRLEGKWLEKLGFKKGHKIQIQESKKN